MFHTVLIANRGEIALRVITTCRRLGVRTVAVYSDADAEAAHTRAADLAVRLGPAPAKDSYLDIAKVIAAARATGAQAIHPGYGFLSENADFARACEDAGIVFLGPDSTAIETMGDKIAAKQAVAARDVPLVPGVARAGLSDAQLAAAAMGIGLPVLIKPSAGGGGKGMHAVHHEAELLPALAAARREAAAGFGDDTLFLERLIAHPRHIEVQILADSHGTVIHLGERECSLQRRHQKVIEEAPSALLDPDTRDRIGEAARQTALAVGYRGAGTVEFILSADRPEEFFFMEMNTRLQVEHPVTEEVTGLDLVEQMLLIGAGEPLHITQDQVDLHGHAIEARIYAEDPARGFLPTGGRALDVCLPAATAFTRASAQSQGNGIRVDAGLSAGQPIVSAYDPMIAKVIATGPDRATALSRLEYALAGCAIPGITTNIDFLRKLLTRDDVRAGDLTTEIIDGLSATELEHAPGPIDRLFAAAAVVSTGGGAGADPAWDGELAPPAPVKAGAWDRPTGWRLGRPPHTTVPLLESGEPVAVDYPYPDLGAATATPGWSMTVDGVRHTARIWARSADRQIWVASERGVYSFVRPTADANLDPGTVGAELTAPMPGSVIAVHAADGAQVTAGQALLVVEAMKMEHVLTAPVDGVLALETVPGAQVALDEVLARVVPETQSEE